MGAALGLAISALLGKVLLRYRICDAGLVTWGQGLAMSAVALILCAAMRLPFPKSGWIFVIALATSLLLAARSAPC